MGKKILIFLGIAVSLFAAGNPSLVEVAKLVKGEVNPLQEFVGTVSFDRSSVLAAQNSGVVKAINFNVGDRVKKGKTLVQIDADVLNAQIVAAKANLQAALDQEENSSKDYARYKKLLESKSITQKEYDDALLKKDSSKSSVKALKANLKQLQIEASKKGIKAPYSGIIVDKKINLGEWVNAGTAVASIVDTSKAEITFSIPFNIYNGLRINDTYEIQIGKNIVQGKLSAAIPSGDKLTRTFPIKFKASLPTKGFIFEGQQAKVSLSKDEKKEAFILPRDAVIKRFGQNIVFFIDDKNIAQMVPVQIIGFLDDKVAIASNNLKEGMDIVSKGNERVFPNSPVKILNKK